MLLTTQVLTLTIKPAVSLGKSGQKELAVVFDGFEEVPLALESQCFLHLTGAAGVVLRTEPQVLTWTKVKAGQKRMRLGLITHVIRNLCGLSFIIIQQLVISHNQVVMF